MQNSHDVKLLKRKAMDMFRLCGRAFALETFADEMVSRIKLTFSSGNEQDQMNELGRLVELAKHYQYFDYQNQVHIEGVGIVWIELVLQASIALLNQRMDEVLLWYKVLFVFEFYFQQPPDAVKHKERMRESKDALEKANVDVQREEDELTEIFATRRQQDEEAPQTSDRPDICECCGLRDRERIKDRLICGLRDRERMKDRLIERLQRQIEGLNLYVNILETDEWTQCIVDSGEYYDSDPENQQEEQKENEEESEKKQ